MTKREQLKVFFSADRDYINLHAYDLRCLLKTLKPEDVVGMEEHHQLIDLIAEFRKVIERYNALNGDNFNATLRSLLSVGEDGLYSDPLRFLFELIQNVDDCDYDVPDPKLSIDFKGNVIQLNYNERGFEPFNVFAITGIAEAAKNLDDSKIEIGEKGLGFKSVFGIAQSVLIQSGFFSFRLDKEHFTIPIPEYRDYERVEGTRMTLTLKNTSEVDRICGLIKERYCKPDAIFRQNPILFLKNLRALELRVDNSEKQLLFVADRKTPQKLNKRLSVERDITIWAFLKSLTGKESKDDFREKIVGDRYTYHIVYDRAMCQSRYGDHTSLSNKQMTLQVIYPHLKYLGDGKNMDTGALYSFLPTQIKINAPIIIHAPFKLDGSREYVDSQGNNAWFTHTIGNLFVMLEESLEDSAKKVHENILHYIPKKYKYIFSGEKSPSLRTAEYTGKRLLEGRVFWGADQSFHTRREIRAYDGNLPSEEQLRIHNVLKGKLQLFVMPSGLKASDYGIDVVEDPYFMLLSKALYDVKALQSTLPILCDWVTRTSENELIKRLDSYIPVNSEGAFRNAASIVGGEELKRRISLKHVELMAQHPVFAKPFSKWVQRRLAVYSDLTFEFHDECKTTDVRSIDPENPFNIQDVGMNARKYLQSIKCRCVLVPGNGICIPTRESLLLSKNNSLELFAEFCKVMDRDTQFDVTLKMMANSKRLNDAEESMSTEAFLQLLKDVRVGVKMALRKSYDNYINLLHQSGASPSRFINELFQNADDCIYAEDVVPYMVIQTNQRVLEIQYNETGFTKHNVRAITAIGESTKRQLLSGQTFSRSTIGEKGIGFKAVFSIARRVQIHSNGFHFALEDTAPTVPILDVEEKHQGEPGTYMEIELKKPLPVELFTKTSLLALCLCLRRIKRIRCNQTDVEICDENGWRKITIDGDEHAFEMHHYSFRVTDPDALQERRRGGRDIPETQDIFCYTPIVARKNTEYYLYSGLPTKVKLNIPMYIDAPFELTTSRDNVLENVWNRIMRKRVYRAIFEYTEQNREKLRMRALRFVSVKQDGKVYQNNTFEGNAFLNEVPLNDFARSGVFLPTVGGHLRQTHLTWKYPAFMRRMIETVLGNEPEAGKTLDYSDDAYNAAYLFLGGHIAKAEDILDVLRKVNLPEQLKEDGFRNQLYAWMEGDNTISASETVRRFRIIPVWDKNPGSVTYVSYDEAHIYREQGKNASANDEYWVLNENLMSPVMYTKILGVPIETMDHDQAVRIYKNKLLDAIKPLSAQHVYDYLMQESRVNTLFMEALLTMTDTEQCWLSLQNMDGEIVDSHRIFTLQPGQTVFGSMLRKYIASPECYVLALSLRRKPLEEIQIGDVDDYEDILTGEDLEDLLKSGSPEIRYGRSIAREFFEKGRVEPGAAEDYGLIYAPVAVETRNWMFPSRQIAAPQKLKRHMQEQFDNSPRLFSEFVQKKVRGYISPRDGQFHELDRQSARQTQLSNYEARENNKYCFCQMCKRAKQKDYIEVCCIQYEPSRFLPEIYLSLCLECSKFFRHHTEARKSQFADEFYGKIMNARMNASGNVTIDMEDSYSMQLTFTETHLAEIQAVLPRLRADGGVAASENTLAMDDSAAWEDGQAIQPVLPIGKLSSPSTGNECSKSSNQEIDKENETDKEALVFPVHITGEEAGDYRLVVYNGKLKRYTALKPEPRFISIVHQGRNKLIAVSLIEQEKTLYVAKQMYRTYSGVIQKMQSLPMQKP